ncbi:hypothetical protein TKK_0003501 [Trichogramma kaykai]|uniref:Uncharacterized protein n=1 Tax=Trichogramma kaykai TaxID=54128 RepID=A0ABD2XR59_9HYME
MTTNEIMMDLDNPDPDGRRINTNTKRKIDDQQTYPTETSNKRQNNNNNTLPPTEHNEGTDTTSKIPLEFYKPTSKGPFSVWIRNKTANKEVSHFNVDSLLYKTYSGIQEIFRRSRSKVEIIVLSRDQANKLANDQSLSDHDLEAYVPGFRKTRKGIVRGIDVEFGEDQLMEGASCPEFTRIVGINRMNRKEKSISVTQIPAASEKDKDQNQDKKIKWVPTKSVIVTFEGQSLPDSMCVWGVRVKV